MSNSNCGCGSVNDAVCIEAERIYDSCCDKECLKDLCVTLDGSQCYIEGNYTVAKTRDITVSDVCICVEQVPFNNGFYSVDITYTFSLTFDLYEKPCTTPTTATGTAVYSKKVILYGGAGNSRTFCSEDGCNVPAVCQGNCDLPKACVQVVDPLVLETKLYPLNCRCRHDDIPDEEECCCCSSPSRRQCIYVTIGLFSITKLTRQVAILVPVYDFCIPKKSCCGTSSDESACEVFDKIDFPTDEFFPKALECNGCTSCDCLNEET